MDGCGEVLVSTWEREPGTVIRDKFRLVKLLGRGTFGEVYLADHLLMQEQCALKFLSAKWIDSPSFLERFRREARATKKLRHPNVVEVFDLDQDEDGIPFIAMEYVHGPELRVELHNGGLPIERALALARGIAMGLREAHAKGIIHRDIKPENILIANVHTDAETPKLLDFGIAAMQDSSMDRNRTQGPLYTPAYAAPEQLKGMPAEQMDGRADLYALGGVLYEMLTGDACTDPRIPPSRLRPELVQWKGLDSAVLHLLVNERSERPQNVDAFLLELDAVIHGESGVERKQKHAWPSWKVIAGILLGAAAVSMLAVWAQHTLHPQSSSLLFLAPGSVRANPQDGLNYVWIPSGDFEMGCSEGDPHCQLQEKPRHAVAISQGFWMGQTPVTVAAWKRYRRGTGAPPLPTADGDGGTNWNEGGADNMPVVMATWQEAKSYCEWAGMRLPTEAEWEYAARAGSNGPRYGDADGIAWFGNNSGEKQIDAGDLWTRLGEDAGRYEGGLKANHNTVHPVGEKQANAWKLFDMLGNLQEWTSDWFDDDYFQNSPNRDPQGPFSGTKKVVRGASWANVESWTRVSLRSGMDPDGHWNQVGFRCAGKL
jgi:formylglycine-generating enzyme required for sulfatase activity/tRNA A-37 threonylcarbamoyl transferase component Bud32